MLIELTSESIWAWYFVGFFKVIVNSISLIDTGLSNVYFFLHALSQANFKKLVNFIEVIKSAQSCSQSSFLSS